jgi:hypothetical protein
MGFEFKRIPKNKPYNKIDLLELGCLKNHHLHVDLLKYSDHKELSSQFLSKLNSGHYNFLDRDCILCGGAALFNYRQVNIWF